MNLFKSTFTIGMFLVVFSLVGCGREESKSTASIPEAPVAAETIQATDAETLEAESQPTEVEEVLELEPLVVSEEVVTLDDTRYEVILVESEGDESDEYEEAQRIAEAEAAFNSRITGGVVSVREPMPDGAVKVHSLLDSTECISSERNAYRLCTTKLVRNAGFENAKFDKLFTFNDATKYHSVYVVD